MISGEKILDIKYVLIFTTTFVRNISHFYEEFSDTLSRMYEHLHVK